MKRLALTYRDRHGRLRRLGRTRLDPRQSELAAVIRLPVRNLRAEVLEVFRAAKRGET